MSKKLKKIVSVILALAMVITGLQFSPGNVKAAEEELPTSQEISKLAAPTDVYLYDFRTSNEGYKIIFKDADADTYTVAEGDVKAFDVYMGEEKIATVSKSGEQIDLSALDMLDKETYEITVKQVLTKVTEDGTEKLESDASAVNYFTYDEDGAVPVKVNGEDTGIAKVFVTTTRDINTKEHDLYTSSDKVDVKSALVVQKADGSVDCAGEGSIKLRGNSTSTGQKKPYNIKFSSKQNVFGFGKAKKWSLLANTFDKSLIRNQIGVQFHHKIMEANQIYQFTSECEPIDLYLDGHYLGSYLLLESVQAGSTRVDIDAENVDNHEILLELDMTDRDAAKDAHLDAHTNLMNMSFTINEPEGPGTEAADENHADHQEWLEFNETYAAKKQYTLNYLNNLETKIQNGGDGTLDEIGQFIDVDSFVNYYITAELFRITDVSFSSVRYFIKKADDGTEKLYAGPLWDLDLSSGNADGAAANPDFDMHAQENPWFGALMKNKEFAAKVTERFNEVLPEINNLVADGGTIDTVVNTLRKSIDANYSSLAYNVFNMNEDGTSNGWGVDKIYTAGHHECSTADEARATGNVSGSLVIYDNYDGYLNDFKSYMTGRIKYLKKQFDATDYDEVLTEIEDQMGSNVYNLAKKKKASVYKNVHQEGKLEYLNDGNVTDGQYCPIVNADTVDAWGSENGDPVYATIDLGKYYKAETIDKIVVQYKDGQANDTVLDKAYSIQYSIDGNDFRDVAGSERASLDENNRTIDDVSAEKGIVRYVRLYFPKQAGYGMQIKEFAVLDTDKNAETVEKQEVEDASNLQLTTPADNQIGVLFDASVTEGVTYSIYVDGKLAMSNAVAGEINILTEIEAGERTVKVVTSTDVGFVSAGISATAIVTGYISVEQMLVSPQYNLAYQKDWVLLQQDGTDGKNSTEGTGSVTDGKLGSDISYYATPVKGQSGSYFTIDLGKEYDSDGVDSVYVWYRNNFGGCYPERGGHEIQFSRNNEEFVTVATVSQSELDAQRSEQNSSPFVISVDITDAKEDIGSVRYVRVYYPEAVAYGAQVSEIAVFDTDLDAKEADPAVEVNDPEGFTAVSEAYNTISGTITAGEGQEDYKYSIYLNGKVVKKGIPAGDYVLEDVAGGVYDVKVVSVYQGYSSTGITVSNVKVDEAFVYSNTFAENDQQKLFPDTNENGNNYVRYDGVTATASSGDAYGAIDNNPGTRWESASSDPQEIVINLGNVYSVKEIDASWETASSKDFTVAVSTDGENYTTVAIIKNAAAGNNRLDKIVLTDAADAKYIKLRGTARTTGYGHSIWEMAVYGPSDARLVVKAPTQLKVYNYAKFTGKYFVEFIHTASAESYNIYIDNTFIKNVSASGNYLTSEELAAFENGEHTLAVKAVGAENVESDAVTTTVNIQNKGNLDDIPQIYISTHEKVIDGTYFAKKGDHLANVNVAVIDNTGTYSDIIDAASDIKVRGNTTAGGEKKPWNIKLGKKSKVLGMDSAKKWSLLANAFDKSLIRNGLVMQLAHMMGLSYTSDCRFVDIYLNGEYQGNYLIIESVETGAGRIEIDANNAESNDILLELDNNGRDMSEAAHLNRSDLGVLLMMNEPEIEPNDTESLEIFKNKIDYTQDLIAKFENALKADDYNEMSKYVDMESFAKFYIVNEFFSNQDFNFSSTRFYIKDNKMYAGPCWDYDLSSGNFGPYYNKTDEGRYEFLAKQMAWYTGLMENQEFKNLVAKYYSQYLPEIKAVYNGSMASEGYGIQGLVNLYSNSFERNYKAKDELGAGWSVTNPDMADGFSYANYREWNTYTDTIDYLKQWLSDRNIWLETQLGINDPDMPASIVNRNGEVVIRWNDETGRIPEYYEITYSKFISYNEDNYSVEKEDATVRAEASEKEIVITDMLAGNTDVTVKAVYSDNEESSSEFIGTAVAKADLVISDLWLDNAPVIAGNNAFFKIAIANIGTAVAYPTDDVIATILKVDGNQVNFTADYKKALNPNETDSDYGFQMDWNNVTAGKHRVSAFVDDRNKVVESNESNNTLTKEFIFDSTVARPEGVSAEVTDGVPYVTITASDEQIEAGYLYDIYVDGTPVLSGVAAGTYQLENISSGEHTITVYSRYNEDTSIGTDVKIDILEEQTETSTAPEETTVYKKKVVAFNYSNEGKIAGADVDEYAYEDNDYNYKATSGTGVYEISVTGANLKHLEWSKDSYSKTDGTLIGIAPVVKASKSNFWSADAYAKYTFSTTGYTGMTMSIDLGATNNGPSNFKVVYEDETGAEQIIGEAHLSAGKVIGTYTFEVPQAIENKESVSIYVKLMDTVSISGTDITAEENKTSGYWAINNFEVTVPSDEEETTTPEETTTEGETEPPTYANKIVAYEYDGSSSTVGEDVAEYANPSDDYVYYATIGNGTMKGSINGTNLKHMEWADSADYGVVIPAFAAGSTNKWSTDMYIEYTFSTKDYTDLQGSVQVAGTKKGPKNLIIGYYEGDEFRTITEYTLAKNKIIYTVNFDIPQELEDKEDVTVYIKLKDTTNIGGNEMTDDAYNTGGEIAINNFVIAKNSDVEKNLPGNISNLKVTSTLTEISASWKAPEGVSCNAYLYDAEGTLLDEQKDVISYTYDNAQPDTTYTLKITTVGEGVETSGIITTVITPEVTPEPEV